MSRLSTLIACPDRRPLAPGLGAVELLLRYDHPLTCGLFNAPMEFSLANTIKMSAVSAAERRINRNLASPESIWHRRADGATGALLFGMIIFSPWAFGGWPEWSIWTMNIGGVLLGILFLFRILIRWTTGVEPIRWSGRQPVALRFGLGILTVLLLAWCLTSAVNARSVVDLESLRLTEHAGWVSWLPHSDDQPSTWFAFWQYLGLAGVFWGLRDWITVASPVEQRSFRSLRGTSGQHDDHRRVRREFHPAHRLPHRLRRLMWVLSLNGGAVALIGILSTIDNPPKVLWIMTHAYRDGEFFGPFYYRNNGAQFVNLIWPLCLGLWLTEGLRFDPAGSTRPWFRRAMSGILPLCLVLMIAAPFLAKSRGGSIVAVLMLIASIPVLVWGIRASRRILLLSLVTLLAGLSVGAWFAWEPMKERFFREFVSYPTRVRERLDAYTIRSTIRVPSKWGKEPATFAGLSDSNKWLWDTANSMTLSLRRPGRFEARFVGTDRTRMLTLVATNALLAQAGRTVELIFTHHAEDSALYLNGERLELRPVKTRADFDWPADPASRFLWVGRGAGGSMKFNDRIEAVTLLDRSLPDSKIRELADREPRPEFMIGANWWGNRWAGLNPRPVLDIRPYAFAPSQWFAAGLGGRVLLDALSRRMMHRYSSALGTGPGTFANLFKVFRQDRDPAADWYAHDDYLETRITFGVLGAGLIYTALFLCCAAVLCRGGVPAPWYCLVLTGIGLAGTLLHARFDWVFQTHSLLFLGIIICSAMAASSLRLWRRG